MDTNGFYYDTYPGNLLCQSFPSLMDYELTSNSSNRYITAIHAAQIGFAISMVKIIPISSVKSQN